MAVRMWWMALGASGCVFVLGEGDKDDGDVIPRDSDGVPFVDTRIEDVGVACVFSEAEDPPEPLASDALPADAPIDIAVWFDTCASGCVEVLETDCTIDRLGSTVEVFANATVREPAAPTACDDVCVPVFTRCRVAGLPAGPYQLSYAGEEVRVFLPSDGPTPCTGVLP